MHLPYGPSSHQSAGLNLAKNRFRHRPTQNDELKNKHTTQMADLMRILMQINVKTLIRRYFQRSAHCRPYLILFYKQLKMYKSG